ncbi:uncharacterized protein LOC124916443 [Impatiens glandulifera]|uniref:uncharacterized protein LOC124916443 n=1 Tax=Impatiens glandulifera TaxID=253017 RepID=UPI001FB12DE7|nr:uncharacterized protein LOC124916443 [Impatiens glandulifera]
MAAAMNPFQLLEINIISAQDLQLHSKKMRSFATAWVHTNRKLTTVTDTQGGNNPTWNDKFVFRIDEEFLRRDTSAVMIEIYSVGWWKNTLIGTVRVLIGNLFPPQSAAKRHQAQRGMRFVALQVRRPSGRPQGILNIGITVLDPSKRSMPLYNHLAASSAASAVGFRDLMEENGTGGWNQKAGSFLPPPVEPVLRRSKSERSDWFPNDNDGSIISILTKEDMFGKLDSTPWQGKKKGKSSSVINGSELRDNIKETGPKKKSSSVINVPILFSRKETRTDPKPGQNQPEDPPKEKEKPPHAIKSTKSSPKPVPGKAVAKYSHHGPKGSSVVNGNNGAPRKANSIWSDSEVGPSPSEVAAVMASRQRRYPLDDDKSSMMDGWSMDESEEGLRSKMERWRTELPPLYDRSFTESSCRDAAGMFSCFGNVCGLECQIVCGKPPEETKPTRNERNQYQSPFRNGGQSAGRYESPYGNAGRYESPQGNAGRYKSPRRGGNGGRYRSPQGKQGRSGERYRSSPDNVGRTANRFRSP